MKKQRIIIGSAAAVFLAVFAIMFACKGADGTFGSKESNPIIKMDEMSRLLDTQKVLRAIHDAYDGRVVFITTEQIVKVPSNPFEDDFFAPFFENRRSGNGQQRTQKVKGLGSGFIISEDGYVCTNNHVVAGADKVFIKIKGKDYQAEVVGTDERTDLALIKIKSDDKFKPVFMGNSDNANVGDWAIAIGNPYALENTFTVGFLSAVGRKELDMPGGSQSFLQTDAPINPGNSGGPLINIKGEVIGVNSMILSQSGGNIGLGFAIPINTAKTILEQLKLYKKIKRGYLGIQIVPLNEDYAKERGLSDKSGAIIGQVEPDGPAAKAGMKIDDIILSVDGKKITSAGELVETAGNLQIGKTVQVKILRGKTELTLFVTVKERP